MKKDFTHCKWATPTLFREWPFSLDAWTWPWTCAQRGRAKLLSSSETCQTCFHWEIRPAGAEPPAFVDDRLDRD